MTALQSMAVAPFTRGPRAAGWTLLIATAFAVVLVGIAGCGPVQLSASSRIPTPLIVKLPVTVALFMPQPFAQYVHKEERWGTDWNIDIGKAQSDAMTQLVNAMFDKFIAVDSVAAGGALGSKVTAISRFCTPPVSFTEMRLEAFRVTMRFNGGSFKAAAVPPGGGPTPVAAMPTSNPLRLMNEADTSR